MSRLVQIGHSDALDLDIPASAVRFYAIHSDEVSVDKRRLRRHIRRARHYPCAALLREWWIRKLNGLDRRL